jgi:hypothetical protein
MQFCPSSFFLLLGLNIILNILLSNTRSLRSFLKARYQTSQPENITGQIPKLYGLIFRFFMWERKTKDYEP